MIHPTVSYVRLNEIDGLRGPTSSWLLSIAENYQYRSPTKHLFRLIKGALLVKYKSEYGIYSNLLRKQSVGRIHFRAALFKPNTCLVFAGYTLTFLGSYQQTRPQGAQPL